jgi:hypothetical protein
MNITLHPKLGVNPVLTVCPQCGKEANELALVGYKRKYTCKKCGQQCVGKPKGCCQVCQHHDFDKTDFSYGDRIAATEPCDTCKELNRTTKEIIKAGGIYFRCTDCKAEGTIKASNPYAMAVREHAKIFPPNPVGVEFTKDDCPVCSKGAKDGTNG